MAIFKGKQRKRQLRKNGQRRRKPEQCITGTKRGVFQDSGGAQL